MRELLAIGRRMTVVEGVAEVCFLCGIFEDSADFEVGSGSIIRETGPALSTLALKRE